MESEVEILISHLQAEHDYLVAEMKLCIDDWDYIGAEAFRKPLIYTKRKLNTAKCIHNPNIQEISQFHFHIKNLTKMLKSKKCEFNLFDAHLKLYSNK